MHRIVVGVTALVIGCAPLLSYSQPAQAAPIQSSYLDQTHPRVMDVAADLAAQPATSAQLAAAQFTPLTVIPRAVSGSHPQREIFGFVDAGNLGSPTVGYPSWDFSLLTTVAFFDLGVNSGDGHLVSSGQGWNVYHSTTMQNFVNTAHAHGVRVIVSINLHDFSTDPNNQVCTGLIPANSAQTVQWAVSQMQWAGIDGINVNYEGTITTCADGQTNRSELTSFVANLRAAMTAAQPGSYLSIDTFTGSAEDNQEFFDVTGLAPSVDSMFVMAYDMDYENSLNPPLSCSAYCTNPVSPLSGYRFNVTTSMAQYTALVPASKVILGQPYYGRRGCVGNLGSAHQLLIPNTNFVAPTYLFASTIPSQTGVYAFAGHRDPIDGVSEWDTWYDSDWNCNRLQFFDDPGSLGAKYDLVNRDNLRGVGFFTLDYGGGAPELWSALSTYFSCPVTINLPATQATTEFSVGLTAGSCSVGYYEVQQFDVTLNQGWFPAGTAVPSGGSGTLIAEGFQGHDYQIRARTHSIGGVVSSWAYAVTTVSTGATASHPFKGLYTMDAWGGVHTDNSPPLGGFSYWPGWRIVRAVHALPGPASPVSGAVLDGYGGLHSYGAPISISSSVYWSGWDIARDFAFLPDGSGGFVLDGWGGLHPFRVNGSTAPLVAQGFTYWYGWDIARKVVIFPDGTGGYVMDAWGGLHPFGINRPSPVSAVATTGYWPNWSIARDIELVPGNGNHSGYVMDGWGGMHPFHPTTDGSTMPPSIKTAYWYGWDIARSLWFLPGSATAGYTLDGYGGIHPFGGAPAITGFTYWLGWDIAAFIWGG